MAVGLKKKRLCSVFEVINVTEDFKRKDPRLAVERWVRGGWGTCFLFFPTPSGGIVCGQAWLLEMKDRLRGCGIVKSWILSPKPSFFAFFCTPFLWLYALTLNFLLFCRLNEISFVILNEYGSIQNKWNALVSKPNRHGGVLTRFSSVCKYLQIHTLNNNHSTVHVDNTSIYCVTVDSKPLFPFLWESLLHLMPCPLLPAYLKSAKPWNESHIISGWTEYFTAGGRKWDLPSRDCLQCILLGEANGRSHTVHNTVEQLYIYPAHLWEISLFF